ncbi:MAG: type IX secretion system membrane protein PorP/SprF [Bacteroidetes bacterium]|nr:type IX secretion system membrane protein PorP/SprF [Bacteroidota bacterium]
MKKILKVLIFLLAPSNIFGQLTPMTNQYVLNPIIINPSCAGARGTLNMATFYRNQWVGIDGSPKTMTLAVDAPLLNKKIGLGLIIVNDKIGVKKDNQFILNYAFNINLGESFLSMGLGAGITMTNVSWSDLVVLDPGDELYLVDSRVFIIPDFSFGLYYTNKNYFAGFSMPQFLTARFNSDKNGYTLANDPKQYNYLFNTGIELEFATNFKFFPSALFIYTPGEKLQYDINAHFGFRDLIRIGGSYRNNRSIAAMLQVQLNNQLRIACSYDFDVGKLRRYSAGSYEIMVRYLFSYKVDAINPVNF